MSAGSALALADDADAHALPVQLGEVAADEDAEQPEEEARPRRAGRDQFSDEKLKSVR